MKTACLDLRLHTRTIAGSRTLAFEPVFKGEADILFMSEITGEWETAAAQTVLKELGKNLYDFETKEENRYNKPVLKNNSLIVR